MEGVGAMGRIHVVGEGLPADMAAELEPIVQGARDTMRRLYGIGPNDLDDLCGEARATLCRLAGKLRQFTGDDRLRMSREIVNDTMNYCRRRERVRNRRETSLLAEHLETFASGVDDWRMA